MSQVFSSGKYARAMCDRCGIEVKYVDLRLEWTGLKTCGECWDPKTALEFPTNFPADAESLRDPRPDNDVEANAGVISVVNTIGTSFQGYLIEVELGDLLIETEFAVR